MQTQIYSVVSQKSLEGGASGRTRRTRRAPANSETGTGVAFRCDYKHVDLRFRRGVVWVEMDNNNLYICALISSFR